MRERRLRPRDAVRGEGTRLQLTRTIVGAFRQMPGLSLSLAEAAPFFGLRPVTCAIVFDELVGQGHLRRAPNGRYTGHCSS